MLATAFPVDSFFSSSEGPEFHGELVRLEKGLEDSKW